MTLEYPPLVSVLMSVRNGMPYLPAAVESIVRQTFDDWELVINDNDSTDGSTEYLRACADADTRIKLLPPMDDLGLAGGLNRGLAYCRGDWVARMDADDVALPQRLERQLTFVYANPDVTTLGTLAYYVNAKGERFSRAPHDLITRGDYERYMATDEVIGFVHSSALISRRALYEVEGYGADSKLVEDIDLWNRLSERGVVLVLPEYLMEYRVHGDSQLAGAYRLAARKRRWVQAQMIARRDGREEPTWGDFHELCSEAPFGARMRLGREIWHEALCRQAREELARGRRLRAYARFAIASLLRPLYSASRFKGYAAKGGRPPFPSRRAKDLKAGGTPDPAEARLRYAQRDRGLEASDGTARSARAWSPR